MVDDHQEEPILEEPRPDESGTTASSQAILLFLSFDIVGSTAYKQKGGPIDDWLTPVKSFFIGTREALTADQTPDKIRPFKYLGDEIIFVADPTQVWLPELMEKAFDALQTAASELESHSIRLSAKGAAWLVHLEEKRNISIRIGGEEEEQKRSEERPETPRTRPGKRLLGNSADVIGANMDEGFRVAGAFARRRQLAISFELAWTLSSRTDSPRAFYLSQPRPLKGVWAGVPYPPIWYNPNVWADIEAELPYFYKEDDLFQQMSRHRLPMRGNELEQQLRPIIAYHQRLSKDCVLEQDLEDMQRLLASKDPASDDPEDPS
nr:hypothetical protein 4 [bacterium]